MTRRLKVAIVGYSVAGISAAIFLRRLGHDVTHFERAAAPAVGGAGMLLNPTGLQVLDRLGVRGMAMSRGAGVRRVYGETIGGSRLLDLRYDDHFHGNLGLGIQRDALLELLRAADGHAPHLQTSRSIAAVEATRGYLVDERHQRLGPFDLIVGADGANSRIRRSLNSLIRHDRQYRWGAVVCLLDDPSGVGGEQVFQSFGGTRHVSLWPVGSREPGAPRRINVSMNVAVDQLESFRDPGTWKRHVADLCPRIVPLLRQPIDTHDLLSYTYRDVAVRRYYDHRVVLIGDAAHSMSPQLGQGASMGLLDSWALCRALQRNQDVARALIDFDRERRAQVSVYQLISRLVTPIFQSESRALALVRDRTFYRLSRSPFVKDSMLRTLSGRQQSSLAPRELIDAAVARLCSLLR